MLKRIILYFVGFVILASLAYYGFNRWKDAKEKVDLWTLVPESAAFVVETNNHIALVNHLQETELWQSFSMVPAFQRLQQQLTFLDSISPGNQRLERFLDKKNILTSVHVAGKDQLQFVYYVPVNSVGEHRFLRTLNENLSRSTFYEEESHKYQGHQVTEITNTQLNSTFTYFSYHNNIILSPSPALVEEIIRRIERGKTISLAAEFKKTNYLNQPDVYANFFINYSALPEVLGLFLREELMPEVRYLTSLCRNGLLELKLSPDKLFMNGFSNPETLKNSFHQNITPAKPQLLKVSNYLPNKTAIMLHFGLQEIAKLRRQSQNNPVTSINKAIVDSLAQSFSNEVALVYLETFNINASPEKVVYAHMGNPSITENLIAKLEQQATSTRSRQANAETYGSYTIQRVNMPELPKQLFGSLFSGFEQTYVAQVDDYMLFASGIATLRALLDDISDEKVWSKSVTQKALLDETLQEANFSLFLNTVNAWYILNRYITDEDRAELLQNATLIKRFNQVSVQFANVDKQYYTSILIRKQERGVAADDGSYHVELTLPFKRELQSRPYLIQNAIDKTREVVVQDSANMLFNINATGKLGWEDSVYSAIRGEMKQIELGSEKQLRYVFPTQNRIHAIDNQGKSIENFPFNIGDSVNIQHLAVFDYENTGDYRLLVDDSLGNLYMYNLQGNSIEGWLPRRMDYKLASEPQHLRVGGRDVILVVLENGYIYALTRQGDNYPGFPISVSSPVSSNVIATLGSDLKSTKVTAVTKYGQLITFNLQGRVLERKKLERPTKRAMFDLVPDSNKGSSYVVVRQEQGHVTVFDQNSNKLFDKRYVTSAPKVVQYYHFGGSKRIIAITETGPQKTYLYNTKGDLIGNTTLNSSQPVTIFYNQSLNSFTLYKVYQNELQKINFKLPK